MKGSLLPALLLALFPTFGRAAEPTTTEVLGDMKRVADWQIAHPSKHGITDWTHGPFFLGIFNLHQVSDDDHYLKALTEFGTRANWGPGKRVTHADDHAVLQAWLEAYGLQQDKARLAPTIGLFPEILEALADQPKASVTGGTFTWCWCDALFMSPAVWCHLSEITDDPKYLEWADREWWTCTDVLYDPTACLYYRDNKYFERRTETGRKIFWSRGNGWVVGGLVHMLNRLPADHAARDRYLALYRDMMHAIVKVQGSDGLWRSSLLDPEGPVGESSGSAFFTYAMAWGVNRGLLPANTFRPAVMKGWRALAGNIQPDGRLGFVQQIGERPGAAGPQSTEVCGSGAFLLAGSEIVRMIDPSKRRKGLASFEDVMLLERFLREEPRVHARFVPERNDDFAWENDLIAFRIYGPAMRHGAEDSGFDAWLKRVPYPIIDKWYMEDRMVLPYGGVNKSYHGDQGEGYDAYKVGNTRGCGGVSLWLDGQLHISDTFVAHRVIETTRQRAVFELDYASETGGKVVRETKCITVLMEQRLFQCESRFTIDGQAGPINVAIGLKPQAQDTRPLFSPKTGTMLMWEKLDGLGLGTAIAIDPSSVLSMTTHTDLAGQLQALCLARTDNSGYIRWFAGYGWEGQGVIKTVGDWESYLRRFAAKFVKKPFADHAASLKVHDLNPPVDPLALAPVDGVPGATLIKPNGGWCWYQGPRAIVTRGGKVVFTTVSGDTYGSLDAGDLWATSWDPASGEVTHFELHDKFQRDDHDVAGLLECSDGLILAVYGKHGNDKLQRWRTTTKPGSIASWSAESTFDVGARYTYSNTFRLSAENNRIYNFSRTRGYNPNCTISDDGGRSWRYGWRLLSWTKPDYIEDPRHTGIDGSRPYLRYASNNTDTIHFITTDDHPRAYDNSVYHGFYRGGRLHDSLGEVIGEPGLDGASPLKPRSFTEIFRGGANKVAWTIDLELDGHGYPYAAFCVQVDGGKGRGKRVRECGNDHRYWYARFNGRQWQVNEMAYAGAKLYLQESDYTGLVALDPDDPDTVIISTNADPATGTLLISKADNIRHHELFRGVTDNGGKSWRWSPITKNSTADNLRPLIPANPTGKRIILWCRGDLKSYTDYRLDICALAEDR